MIPSVISFCKRKIFGSKLFAAYMVDVWGWCVADPCECRPLWTNDQFDTNRQIHWDGPHFLYYFYKWANKTPAFAGMPSSFVRFSLTPRPHTHRIVRTAHIVICCVALRVCMFMFIGSSTNNSQQMCVLVTPGTWDRTLAAHIIIL